MARLGAAAGEGLSAKRQTTDDIGHGKHFFRGTGAPWAQAESHAQQNKLGVTVARNS
jgi:hypothetical protein